MIRSPVPALAFATVFGARAEGGVRSMQYQAVAGNPNGVSPDPDPLVSEGAGKNT
ncbi:hypothetical protein [Rhodovulum sp. MB263]|uniref:hypothetical protein n=1 Tax=Rhodovulum sp. (strain MB263) TaxID=308754 RepID=UPI0012DB1397|nr:hypothetical protein [Rhodovulum sp. MB263]